MKCPFCGKEIPEPVVVTPAATAPELAEVLDAATNPPPNVVPEVPISFVHPKRSKVRTT